MITIMTLLGFLTISSSAFAITDPQLDANASKAAADAVVSQHQTDGAVKDQSGNQSYQHFVEITKADVAKLKSYQFSNSTALAKDFFGPTLSGPILVKYLTDRILNVSIGNPDGNVRAKTIGHSTILLPAFFALPQIRRIAILLHEAHHIDPNSDPNVLSPGLHDHIDCPSPFVFQYGSKSYDLSKNWGGYTGEESCDYDDHGAYGLEGTFFVNVALFCTNCGDVKDSAWGGFYQEGLTRIVNGTFAKSFVDQNFKSFGWGPEKVSQMINEGLSAYVNFGKSLAIEKK